MPFVIFKLSVPENASAKQHGRPRQAAVALLVHPDRNNLSDRVRAGQEHARYVHHWSEASCFDLIEF